MSLINKNNSLLLIIDVQEKLSAIMNQRAKVISNIQKLVFVSEKLNLPILVTEQYPKGLGKTVPEIVENLSKYEPIEKTTFSCCKDDKFMEKIKESCKKDIIVCGMESHVCVQQTSIELVDLGYRVYITGDAVCSRRKEDWKFSLHRIRAEGAVVTTTESIIFELMESSNNPEFKDIISIVK